MRSIYWSIAVECYQVIKKKFFVALLMLGLVSTGIGAPAERVSLGYVDFKRSSVGDFMLILEGKTINKWAKDLGAQGPVISAYWKDGKLGLEVTNLGADESGFKELKAQIKASVFPVLQHALQAPFLPALRSGKIRMQKANKQQMSFKDDENKHWELFFDSFPVVSKARLSDGGTLYTYEFDWKIAKQSPEKRVLQKMIVKRDNFKTEIDVAEFKEVQDLILPKTINVTVEASSPIFEDTLEVKEWRINKGDAAEWFIKKKNEEKEAD